MFTKERPVKNVRKMSDEELKYLAHGQSYDLGGKEYAEKEIDRRKKETIGYKLGQAYSKAKEIYNRNKEKREDYYSTRRGPKKTRPSRRPRITRSRNYFSEPLLEYRGRNPLEESFGSFGTNRGKKRKGPDFERLFGGW